MTWPIHRHSHTRTQYTIIQKKESKKKLKETYMYIKNIYIYKNNLVN